MSKASLDKIVYVGHPCPTELKRDWNSKGFRVLDERFKPADQADEVSEPQKRTRSRKSG